MTPRKSQISEADKGFLRFLLSQRKVLLLSLIGLSSVVLFGLYSVKIQLEKNLSADLQATLQSNLETLKIWNEEKKSQVSNWANNASVRERVIALAQLASNNQNPGTILNQSENLAELRKILGPVCISHNYVGFVVFDSTGLQVGALLDEPVGRRELGDYSNFVGRSLEGETVVSIPFFSETPIPNIHGQWKEKWPTMFISAPVRDENGVVIGILAFRLRPEIEFSRIMEIRHTGQSGETYAFDATGLMLSNSRFESRLREMKVLSDDPDQMSMLSVRLIERGKYYNKRNPSLTFGVHQASSGNNGQNIEGYPDYRGVEVIGAWTWLDEFGFGLITEIDRKEGFASFILMKRVFISFFVLLLAVMGAFWFISTRELKAEKEKRKVSDLLEDSEKKANLILSNTLDGIITIHSNGIIQSFNLAAGKVFGYRAEEIVGQNVKVLMPEPYYSAHDEYLKKYLLTGEKKIIGAPREVQARRKDGSLFDLEISISEIFLQEERVFIGLVRDITEKKRIEALSNRMGRILDDSFNEIFIFDAQTFQFVQANRGACQNLGYMREELLAMTPFDIFPDFDVERFEKLIKPLRRGSAPRIVFEAGQKRKNGSTYPVEVRLQLTSVDESSLFLATVQDITERKRSERLQLDAQNELEAKVQQRTGELKAVNETLIEEIAERKVMESALRDQEAQVRAIVENVVDAIVTIDEMGIIMQYNPTAEAIFGYTPEEIIGKNISLLMPEPYKSEHDGYLKNYHETGVAKIIGFKREVWGLRKDGSVFPLDLAVNEFDIGGKRAYTGILRDITENKQAQWALERMTRQNELILNSVGDGIFGVNLEGEIIFYNPPALKMTRFEEEELAGKALHDVLSVLPEGNGPPGRDYPLYQVFNDGTTLSRDEEVFWKKDGSALLAEYICSPIYEDEKIVGGVITFRDILRRKKAEEAMVQAKEEAERANRAKSDFLSRMSHELRTPLNSILGFSQILEMDSMDPLSDRQKPWVSQVRKAGDHLLELINEILDLARIESGKMTVSLENIDVVPLVNEVLVLILPMSNEKKVKIVNMISIPNLVVVADRIRLKQVFLNLLSNAVKYNIDNGLITIFYRKTANNKIRITIEDSGVGFSKDKVDDLFEPFTRLDPGNSEIEGTGIGLAITRRLMDQMNGDILVESIPGEGSSFTIELPVGVLQESDNGHKDSSKESLPQTTNPNKKYTILYVEDNQDNLVLIRQTLKPRSNIKLITAKEGKTGIEMALAHHPDLILMDINLPGMDGFSVLRALQAYKEIRKIPIVAVSANAMKEDMDYGLKAGFNDYITKPIDIYRFMEVVDRHLMQGKGASLESSQ